MADTLQTGASLTPGGLLISQNGLYRFVFQTDGNIVIYNAQNVAIWSPNVSNNDVIGNSTLLIMQGDGNLVLYGEKTVVTLGKPVPPHVEQTVKFTSNTGGRGEGAYFVMQNDGNAVVYQPSVVATFDTKDSPYRIK